MAEERSIQLPGRQLHGVLVSVEGTEAYIAHRMAEKWRKQVRDKRAKTATATAREVKDAAAIAAVIIGCHYPVASKEDCAPTEGRYGIASLAFKQSMVNAANIKKIGIAKTDARTVLFVKGEVIPVCCESIDAREDVVRLESGVLDLRYRPYYFGWRCEVPIQFYPQGVSVQQVLNLLQQAGESQGVGDWRPEKSGNVYGRWRVAGAVEMPPDKLPAHYLLTEENDLLSQAKSIARGMGGM